MKKRILVLIAFVSLLLTISCSSDSPQLIDFHHDDGEIDLYGQEFWFYTYWEEGYHVCDLVL